MINLFCIHFLLGFCNSSTFSVVVNLNLFWLSRYRFSFVFNAFGNGFCVCLHIFYSISIRSVAGEILNLRFIWGSGTLCACLLYYYPHNIWTNIISFSLQFKSTVMNTANHSYLRQSVTISFPFSPLSISNLQPFNVRCKYHPLFFFSVIS